MDVGGACSRRRRVPRWPVLLAVPDHRRRGRRHHSAEPADDHRSERPRRLDERQHLGDACGLPSDTVQCFTDGVEVNCPGSWTITGLDEGAHTVTATSYDAAMNASDMVYVYWVVDTVGPDATTIAPSGLTTNATVSFDESVDRASRRRRFDS